MSGDKRAIEPKVEQEVKVSDVWQVKSSVDVDACVNKARESWHRQRPRLQNVGRGESEKKYERRGEREKKRKC